MPRCTQFILRDIFTETIEISVAVQICILDNIRRKGVLRIDLLFDPVCQEHVAVITGIPVDNIPDLFRSRLCVLLKTVVDFDKKFIQDRQIVRPLLKCIGDSRPHLRIETAEQLAYLFSELLCCKCRIGIAFFIVVSQNIAVEDLVQALHLFQSIALPNPFTDLSPHILKLQKKDCRILKKRAVFLRRGLLRDHASQPVNSQGMALGTLFIFFSLYLFSAHHLSPPIKITRNRRRTSALPGSPILQVR